MMTTAEVAERLRVSTQTVSRWAKSGTLMSVRIGGVLRFRRSDIDALVAAEATA